MGKVYINGEMEVIIKDHGKIISSMDTENMYGKMEEPMMVIGNMEKCMGEEYIFGKMVENTKDNIAMIKSMVQENIIGQMEKDFREDG